jgi:DNA-binding NtrC family response regulator
MAKLPELDWKTRKPRFAPFFSRRLFPLLIQGLLVRIDAGQCLNRGVDRIHSDCMTPAGILIVDDEETVLLAIQHMLDRQGHRLFFASSPEKATAQLETNFDQIELLITDCNMGFPRAGIELAEELLARKPGLKVLFISGHLPSQLDADDLLVEGKNFLRKPFSVHELRLAVQRIIEAK